MSKDSEETNLSVASVARLIKDAMGESSLRWSNDTRELLTTCCIELVQVITAEAQEICSNEKKKTLTGKHLQDALKKLGFDHYINAVEEVQKSFQEEEEQSKSKKKTKKNPPGYTEEQLYEEQQRLINLARAKQEQLLAATTTNATSNATNNANDTNDTNANVTNVTVNDSTTSVEQQQQQQQVGDNNTIVDLHKYIDNNNNNAVSGETGIYQPKPIQLPMKQK